LRQYNTRFRKKIQGVNDERLKEVLVAA